jgi:putative FmdB family regulatory protein
MPNYDFRCLKCRKRFERFIAYADYETTQVVCPQCGASEVKRIIGRVRMTRHSMQHLAEIADPTNLDQLENNPQALGHTMREMQSEMGEDMGGEFNEVVERLEKGQSPDEIDQAFPDLGSENAAAAASDAD